ncbi:hypothetical protein K439DRAFT_1622424 [Ramaria rubella]|nr:hypothetical protein K439DRAFT_1622424 [Ramaria rubella]
MPIDLPLWGSDDGGGCTDMDTMEAELTVDSILTSDAPMSVDETQASRKQSPENATVVETSHSSKLCEQLHFDKSHSSTRIKKLRKTAADQAMMLKILQATLSQQTMMLQTYEERMQAVFQQQTDIRKVEMQERMRAEEAWEHMLIAKMQEMLAMMNASFMNMLTSSTLMLLTELQKLQALKEDKMAAIIQKQVCGTQTHAGEAIGSSSEVRDAIEQDSSSQPQKRARPSFATLMKCKGYQGITRQTVLVAHKEKVVE